MEGFYKMLEKYHMEKWFQKENLVILVLAGILLIVIALPTKEKDREEQKMVMMQEMVSENAEADAAPQKTAEENTEEYTKALEKKLEDILSRIKGAGEVHVMITLQESEELVVEKDVAEQKEQTVYQSEGNESVPYVVKTIFPKVEGVVVIAQGAGTGKVTQHITEAIQALFPIKVHKIKVTGS